VEQDWKAETTFIYSLVAVKSNRGAVCLKKKPSAISYQLSDLRFEIRDFESSILLILPIHVESLVRRARRRACRGSPSKVMSKASAVC
jgi:hypothetical protein